MRLGYGEEHAGGIALRGGEPFDALLMSRLDFDVRVLDVPPVPEKDVEGLIRLKLRSIYPGNPAETAFDYRMVRRGHVRKAVVFISRKKTVDAYRAAAHRRPLVLPFQLVSSRVPKKGDFRAWVCRERWAELLVYRDGVIVSSAALRIARGKHFELEAEEGKLPEETRSGPVIVVALAEELALMAQTNGAVYLPLEKVRTERGKPDGLFPVAKRKPLPSPGLRAGLLGLTILVLGLLLFFKHVRQMEDYSGRLKNLAETLEKGNQETLAAQKDLDTLLAEKARLDARTPRDIYLLLSELSTVLGDAARIQNITLRDASFQVDAVGTNPLRLMEGLKARASFSDLKLSQVVPDPKTGKERFSISGVFHDR
jgi:hypothetical protein